MLPLNKHTPQAAKENTMIASRQTKYSDYFCCSSLDINGITLMHQITLKPLCEHCFLKEIPQEDVPYIGDLLRICIPFKNISDINCYICEKQICFVRKRANLCNECIAYLNHTIQNDEVISDSEPDTGSESDPDSEALEYEYDSEASTIILERD